MHESFIKKVSPNCEGPKGIWYDAEVRILECLFLKNSKLDSPFFSCINSTNNVVAAKTTNVPSSKSVTPDEVQEVFKKLFQAYKVCMCARLCHQLVI